MLAGTTAEEQRLFLDRSLDDLPGEALAAQGATKGDVQRDAQVDGRLLPLDLARPLRGVGVREVRREAQQRGRLPRLL